MGTFLELYLSGEKRNKKMLASNDQTGQIAFDFTARISYVISRNVFSHRDSGAPNDNFWKISVRKTIWDLEFSEHLLLHFLLACLSQKWYNCPFLTNFCRKKDTWNFRDPFCWLKFSKIPIIFGSLDLQLGNPNRWKIFRG